MSNFTDDQLANLRARLQDFMMGFAGAQASGMDALVRADWALAARVEQLRPHPLVSAFDDDVLAAVAAGNLVPNVEARYLAMRLREVEAEERAEALAARAEPMATSPAHRARVDLPPTVIDMMEMTITLIAKDLLGFKTLEERGRDHLDFKECGVAGVRAALMEAYVEGWHAAA